MESYKIRDKSRPITVIGQYLAGSTSYILGKSRWITFDLYKSSSGVYVLYRVGKSRVFHTSDCDTSVKNNLAPIKSSLVDESWYECRLCQPDKDSQYIFPETDRHYTTTCVDAAGVLEFLSRYDTRTGSTYYTDVSLDLIEDASEVDNAIREAYYGGNAVIS